MGAMEALDPSLLIRPLLLGAVVLGIAWGVTRPLRGPARVALVLGLSILAVGAGYARAARQAAQAASAAVLVRALPEVAPVAGQGSPPLRDYVRSDRCAACHPGQHASWHATYHRTMTQAATPEAVIAPFEGQTLEAKGRRYRLQRRGDEFWVEMADPDWEADLLARRVRPESVPDVSAPRRWKRVVMTTGSHHMQTYWVGSERDGRLFNVPWLWLEADQRWIPREDGFIRPPEGGRTFDVWHDSCIECHAVAGEKIVDSRTGWDPRAAELGIACEACHGPAEEHVRTHRSPARRLAARRDDAPDPTIVNPARLDAQASSQVCGSCHGINLWKPGPLREGVRYRPGEDLRETRVVMRVTEAAAHTTDPLERRNQALLERRLERAAVTNPTVIEERFWPDGMVRVSGREHNGMIESACFEGGELSCLSCHSMHDSEPVDQIARDRAGDAACVQCHPEYAEEPTAHTRHAADSEGSRCQNCHMPHTVYGLLKSIRSHWIDSPSAASTARTGRANACNLCHLDRPLGWTADRLADWYGQPRPALDDDQERVAEGVLQALTGNAHQRAMIAWHMGWPAARAAAGDAWMGFFLGHLLDDPYPAVRYLAGHSLARLEERDAPARDFLAKASLRAQARTDSMAAWRDRAEQASGRSAARLIGEDGRLDEQAFERLARARDDTVMDLRE